MNLVQVDENTIIDKDKVYALVGNQYDGKEYTRIYMVIGDKEKEFLIERNIKNIGALLMEADDGRVC
jgi:hypothetical protein